MMIALIDDRNPDLGPANPCAAAKPPKPATER